MKRFFSAGVTAAQETSVWWVFFSVFFTVLFCRKKTSMCIRFHNNCRLKPCSHHIITGPIVGPFLQLTSAIRILGFTHPPLLFS